MTVSKPFRLGIPMTVVSIRAGIRIESSLAAACPGEEKSREDG
jgi:hypothetical protein